MKVQSILARLMLGFGLFCAMAAPALSQPQFEDQFDGSVLAPGWTILDGYAQQHPADTSNHASVSLTGSQLLISIPGGMEHNMWLLQHTEVTRPYQGDGVYEIKMDSPLNGTQQFGLVFQSAPGTFMIFMLYATDQVRAYIERFANVNGELHKTTFPGWTGVALRRLDQPRDPSTCGSSSMMTLTPPSAPGSGTGPRMARVGLDSCREVSRAQPSTDNIGAIQQVGLFAGNHPPTFDAFDARFDYFRRYASLGDVPLDGALGPRRLAGRQPGRPLLVTGRQRRQLWRLRRRPRPVVRTPCSEMTSNTTYADLTAVNGNLYAYVVRAFRAGSQGPASSEVTAIPR